MAPDRHVILSLGCGVQSTALALMAARGELPLPEAAIFADTGWESAATYAHLAWLMKELDGVLPIHVVRKARRDGSAAHIRDDALAVVAGQRTRMATPPVFVKGSHEYNPSPDPAQQERFARHVGGAANFVVLPLFAHLYRQDEPAPTPMHGRVQDRADHSPHARVDRASKGHSADAATVRGDVDWHLGGGAPDAL